MNNLILSQDEFKSLYKKSEYHHIKEARKVHYNLILKNSIFETMDFSIYFALIWGFICHTYVNHASFAPVVSQHTRDVIFNYAFSIVFFIGVCAKYCDVYDRTNRTKLGPFSVVCFNAYYLFNLLKTKLKKASDVNITDFNTSSKIIYYLISQPIFQSDILINRVETQIEDTKEALVKTKEIKSRLSGNTNQNNSEVIDTVDFHLNNQLNDLNNQLESIKNAIAPIIKLKKDLMIADQATKDLLDIQSVALILEQNKINILNNKRDINRFKQVCWQATKELNEIDSLNQSFLEAKKEILTLV